MSSLHDRDGGADAAAGQQRQTPQEAPQPRQQAQQPQPRAQHDAQPASAGDAPAAPSYAAQLHVDCFLTLRGTGPRARIPDQTQSGGYPHQRRHHARSSQEAAEVRGASIRRPPKLALPDAIIKATGHVAGRLIITRNKKDVTGPTIRIPYELETGTVVHVINVMPPPVQ